MKILGFREESYLDGVVEKDEKGNFIRKQRILNKSILVAKLDNPVDNWCEKQHYCRIELYEKHGLSKSGFYLATTGYIIYETLTKIDMNLYRKCIADNSVNLEDVTESNLCEQTSISNMFFEYSKYGNGTEDSPHGFVKVNTDLFEKPKTNLIEVDFSKNKNN